MSLPDDIAISFSNANKVYTLYQSKWDLLKESLGFKPSNKGQEFKALDNINLDIRKGERIGIVGRNGAGKSTLLKIITGNYQQTSGDVKVNGHVQALMNTGIGFHPEFTGLENIKASLLYNGLDKAQLQEAIDDVIDFVELGDFLHQPFKTYSLGMQSRLQFAISTAIKPEILIVDEVLGAGDAYFSAKSADRMKKLTSSGCTLLLVSHASSQVLQFCDKAIWLESGKIIKKGDALSIIKSYEQFTKKLELQAQESERSYRSSLKPAMPVTQSKWLREKILKSVLEENTTDMSEEKGSTDILSSGGISRWESALEGPVVKSVQILNHLNQDCHIFSSNDAMKFSIEFQSALDGEFDCIFVIMIFTKSGLAISRHRSQKMKLILKKNKNYKVDLFFEQIYFGSNDYVFSVAIFKNFGEKPQYYDLLSRSFEFEINNYDDNSSLFLHPCEWTPISSEVCLVEDGPEHKFESVDN